MSEQTVTYVDLPFCVPPKEKTKQKGKPSRIPEISKQEVIYSELKCHAPSKSQRKPTPTVLKNRESCSESLSWRLIAAILGSLCLVLLAVSGVLGALFLLPSLQVRSQTGIVPQQVEVLKNLTQLNEALKNCTFERDNFKAQNASLKGEKCSAYSDYIPCDNEIAVLTQTHGDKYRPVAYYSSALDPVAARFPPCLPPSCSCSHRHC
ncbi:PREDICTED: uncharacterized protein LOC109319014 [Crocodylus porosus]|uniref:uncharacterized protein LOC109319014 n=1 Tax=Crocodylus porosus TaxID=8502 RepID=UPI00093E26EA|nr:PREDICTED: uncharacterized protein LOC109319014 [Crocodylus porosus]